MKITNEQAREIGKHIGVDWAKADFPLSEFQKGIAVESEHGSKLGKGTDVGGDDKNVAARIAWAHLKELPDYYKRLHKMEIEGEKALEEKTADGDDEEESPGKKVDPSVVAKWFKTHPNPTDDMVHDFAEERGYNTHSLESVIYRAATKGYANSGAKTASGDMLEYFMNHPKKAREYEERRAKKKGNDMPCKTPGEKIKSKGKGRGEARGKGKGPLGIPIDKKKMKKSAAYAIGVKLALQDLQLPTT